MDANNVFLTKYTDAAVKSSVVRKLVAWQFEMPQTISARKKPPGYADLSTDRLH